MYWTSHDLHPPDAYCLRPELRLNIARINLHNSHYNIGDDNSTRQCNSQLKIDVGNQDVILVDVANDITAKQYSQNITTKAHASF